MQPRINVHIPYKRIAGNLDVIREKRLDLEIYVSAEDLDSAGDSAFTELRDALDHAPRLSIHAPFMDLSPAAVDPMVREVTLRRYNQTLRVCEILKPEIMVCHSGYDKWRFNGHRDIWLKGWLQTWEVLQPVLSPGLRIAIENIFDDTPEPLGMLMDHLPADRAGICFDTGHHNLFSQVPLSDWIDRLGPRIIETHLHDNFGQKDDHLPVGTARFDFPAYFRLLKAGGFTPVFTIETHDRPRIEESLANTGRLWTEA